ncbi:MerR family transcriptional regulator [Saccharopolyspora sp. WRP15-2]|uniref:MerR family transcriptional regulator n=1 Tax=Saccharopolyspora oryzae TaxID=2997343 RepID=A0ABT4V3M9_9PSEU|nr:MerR family transcriptional regulator [Saccharopolyspora oryzae]MDA3628565.1 MerR family transcriptional regulator [Saccharopolyspora oryzae]
MDGLSIGEFARASGLTPKALRLYDELGLLPPEHVDQRTGYRTYVLEQLGKAQLVARLRSLGMPLARIRVVVDLPPLAAAAEVMSYWRQVEAETAARREQATALVTDLSRKDFAVTSTSEWELRCAARTDCGLVRRSNEDSVLAGSRLFAVADGFGMEGEERAVSGAALEALRTLDSAESSGDLLRDLGDATGSARRAVHEFSGTERENVGTTLTAMLWSGSGFALAHVGDSRAYLLRGGELAQITHDHTFVQSLVDEGRLTPEEAAAHPKRAELLRALERSGSAEPDLHLREAHTGDRYLLSSDGLHAVLSDRVLRDVLDSASSPKEAVDHFVRQVHDAGAPDNVSCVVIDAVSRN